MGSNAKKTNRRLRSLRNQLGENCWWCGLAMRFDHPGRALPARIDATIEHLTPRADGGTGSKWNLALAHAWCNSARHKRGPDQLREKMVVLVSAWLRNGHHSRPREDAYIVALDRKESVA